MKEKIIIFVIGLLIGGIIASGAFLVYTNVTNTSNCNVQNIGVPPFIPIFWTLQLLVLVTLVYTNVTNTSNCNVQNIGMNGGTPPEMPNRENGTPPEKPDGNNNEPPAKPNDNNTQNSN